MTTEQAQTVIDQLSVLIELVDHVRFFAYAGAIAGGWIIGQMAWRLIILGKNQRSLWSCLAAALGGLWVLVGQSSPAYAEHPEWGREWVDVRLGGSTDDVRWSLGLTCPGQNGNGRLLPPGVYRLMSIGHGGLYQYSEGEAYLELVVEAEAGGNDVFGKYGGVSYTWPHLGRQIAQFKVVAGERPFFGSIPVEPGSEQWRDYTGFECASQSGEVLTAHGFTFEVIAWGPKADGSDGGLEPPGGGGGGGGGGGDGEPPPPPEASVPPPAGANPPPPGTGIACVDAMIGDLWAMGLDEFIGGFSVTGMRAHTVMISIPMPDGQRGEYSISTLPDASTPMGSAVDGLRKWVRFFLEIAAGYTFLSYVFRVLREY